MARQGRAGPALATAALGSFFAGTVATFILARRRAAARARRAELRRAEYFSLIVLGLIASIALAHGSIVKALAMIVLGLLLGMVGQDIYTGTPRFTFGFFELYSGLNFVSVAVGIFGVAEILRNLEHEMTREVMVKKRLEPLADPRGVPPHHRAGAARHRARLAPRRAAGRRPRARLLRLLRHGEARLSARRGVRPRRDRGRRRPRNRPTTPPPRPRSSRC